MKKFYIVLLGILLITITGCFNTEKVANNSVNTKVVSVTDFTIGDFQDALEVASEKACSSVVAIVESGAIMSSLGSAVVVKRTAYYGGVVVPADASLIDEYEYYAITNYHVVDSESVRRIMRIYMGDNTDETGYQTSMVSLIDYDESLDLAILKFRTNIYLEPATIQDSKDLKKGQIVLAVGTPLGLQNYNTVTQGIISHPYRLNIEDNHYYIQHDASINSGNSGGGLFNIEGKLIGINSARAVKKNEDVDGISYAIPTSVIITKYSQYLS